MRRALLPLAAALLLALGSVSTVQAARPQGTIATPAAACRALVAFDAGGYTSFESCMATINADIAAYRFPANPDDPNSPLLNLSQNCRVLEQEFGVSYPYFFDEPEGWPFSEFTAMNHRQCQIAIYSYHRFVGL